MNTSRLVPFELIELCQGPEAMYGVFGHADPELGVLRCRLCALALRDEGAGWTPVFQANLTQVKLNLS